MSFPISYGDAMNRLAHQSEPSEPADVRVKALSTLVRELSPANPHQRASHIALGLEPHPDPAPALPEPRPKRVVARWRRTVHSAVVCIRQFSPT